MVDSVSPKIDICGMNTPTYIKSKPPHTFYERLFAYGHKVHITTNDKGEVTLRLVEITHDDLALAYDIIMKMRNGLKLARIQFLYYADQHRAKQGSHMSLVEQQQLEEKIQRNQGIADALQALLGDSPVLPETGWLDIKTAPRDGSHIRVLGRKRDGKSYVETSYWWNVRWAIELKDGYGTPTHWQQIEQLPQGYD